jgi:hypothetical protein
MQYPPYYIFKGDSLLIISVGKDLFDIVNEKDKVAKETKDLEISVNSLKHIYLSKEKNKWFHSLKSLIRPYGFTQKNRIAPGFCEYVV